MIARNILDFGTSYEFTLTVTDVDGFVSTATETILTNDRPTLGTCFATPSNGTALDTEFRLQCEGWVDTSSTLDYRFEMMKQGIPVVLGPRGSIPYITTTLPSPSTGTTVTINAVIFDEYDSLSQKLFEVTVVKKQINLQEASSEIDSKLAQGDSNGAIIYMTEMANAVDSGSATDNATEAADKLNNLVTQVKLMSENLGTGSRTLAVLNTVTQAGASQNGADLLDQTSRTETVDLVANIVSGESAKLEESEARAGISAIENVLASSSNSETSTEDQKADVTNKATDALTAVAENQLTGVVPGEDSVKTVSAGVEVVGQLATADTVSGSSVSATGGAEVVVSPGLNLGGSGGGANNDTSSGDEIALVLAVLNDNPYPETSAGDEEVGEQNEDGTSGTSGMTFCTFCNILCFLPSMCFSVAHLSRIANRSSGVQDHEERGRAESHKREPTLRDQDSFRLRRQRSKVQVWKIFT